MKVLFIPAGAKPVFTVIGDELADMQTLVGGYIEVVPLGKLRNGLFMVVDEEGKLTGKPLNRVATSIYSNPYDVIVGDAFICKEGIVDGEHDLVGLSSDDVGYLTKELDLDTY